MVFGKVFAEKTDENVGFQYGAVPAQEKKGDQDQQHQVFGEAPGACLFFGWQSGPITHRQEAEQLLQGAEGAQVATIEIAEQKYQ